MAEVFDPAAALDLSGRRAFFVSPLAAGPTQTRPRRAVCCFALTPRTD